MTLTVLASTDMSAVRVEVVVAKASIEESSLQWRFVRQCRVDKWHEHILQSATKCDADNRRNSHAIRWSFLSLSRGHVQGWIFPLRGVFLIVVQNVKVESFYGGDLTFQQARVLSCVFCFHPSGEQSSVFPDAHWNPS